MGSIRQAKLLSSAPSFAVVLLSLRIPYLCCKDFSRKKKSLSPQSDLQTTALSVPSVGKTDLSDDFLIEKHRIGGSSASEALYHELINGRRHHFGFDTTDGLLGDVSFFQMISDRLYTDLRDLSFFTNA